MADREYKILVSYALARNSGAVFQDVEASSARARAKIEGDSRASAAMLARSAKQAADAQAKESAAAARAAEKEAKQIGAAAEKAAAQKIAAAERAGKAEERAAQQSAKAQERAYEYVYRLKQRFMEKEERDADQAAKRAASRATREEHVAGRKREGAFGSFASDTFSGIKGTASRAMGIAGTIAGGMGVKLDLGQQIASAGEFKRTIVDVTNAGLGIQGKLAGKGDYADTTKAVESAADYTKIGQNKIAEGLSVFVDKASDIEAGKAMLKGIGDIAQASGTDFVELAGSAGEFFKMMSGSGPEKVNQVQKLLALAAKQGQVGNLAFKELAPTIGKLASQGQKITGDYSENLGQLMALSQISLQGGAAKGAEATRSGQAFVMDLSKGGTLKAFQKHGVKTFEDQNAQGGGTVLRQMEPLIIELLRKSKGNIKDLTEEFKGTKSGAVIQGAANIFRGAGGTKDLEKGIAAVQEQFDKFKQPMSEAEIKNSAGAVREGAGAKAESFNNQLERIAGSLADRVLPEMEKLGPKVLELVEVFSKVVGWAAENPGLAITAAIVGSIAKAAIGTVVSGAIAKALAGIGGLSIGTATIALTAASIFIAHAMEQRAEGAGDVKETMDKIHKNMVAAEDEYKENKRKGEDGISEGTRKQIEADRERLIELMGRDRGDIGFGKRITGSIVDAKGLGEEEMIHKNVGSIAADKKGIDALISAVGRVEAAVKGNKNVKVDNMPTSGVAAPAAGRQGVSGHGGT